MVPFASPESYYSGLATTTTGTARAFLLCRSYRNYSVVEIASPIEQQPSSKYVLYMIAEYRCVFLTPSCDLLCFAVLPRVQGVFFIVDLFSILIPGRVNLIFYGDFTIN